MAWQQPKTTWGQAGQTVPGVADFNRIEGNIETLGRYDRAPGYGTATGTNAKTITLNPAPGSYYDGLCFAFKNITENTGAVTINVNGLGARPIKKPNGKDLVAGNLKAGSVYTVRYNGTNFILQGSDSTGDAMPEHVLAGKTFSNDDDTELVGTMPNIGIWAQVLTKHHEYAYIPKGYHNGGGVVAVEIENMSADKIKLGEVVGGVVGTLDIGYKKYVIDNYDGDNVDLVVEYISNRKVVIADNIPSGRKKYILYAMHQSFEYIDTLPWSGKFRVWTSKEVYLTKIEQLTDTSLELTFVNEEEISYDARFDILIFYI